MFNRNTFNGDNFNAYRNIRAPREKKLIHKRPHVRLVELSFIIIGSKLLREVLALLVVGARKIVKLIEGIVTGLIIVSIEAIVEATGDTLKRVSNIYNLKSYKLSNIRKNIELKGEKISQTARSYKLCSKVIRNVDYLATVIAIKQLSHLKKYNISGNKINNISYLNNISGDKIEHTSKVFRIDGEKDARKIILGFFDID